MSALLTHTAAGVEIPRAEVLRYLGFGRKAPDEATATLLEECLAEFETTAHYMACSLEMSISISGDGDVIRAGELELHSADLAKALAGCQSAILFAATVGPMADAARERAALQSPAKAVALDAIGTAAVEAFCDALCEGFKRDCEGRGLAVRPRFSPGYGDLALHVQRPLLALLDAPRRAGISLTGALLMTPRKSVSAIVGVGEKGCTARKTGCAECSKVNCLFRQQ
ncbi:MAG TPA: hypothetical protein VN446_05190 [Candidatus Acidoferrum sp.]|nr:hypothetical protein [Candidatus Acidoferrum sp.]